MKSMTVNMMNKYIDANKMVEELSKVPWYEREDEKQVIRMVKDFPAADVAEVKHSHWVEDDDSIIHGHCYRCGWAAIWQETDIFGSNYCPSCGARMVEE